jgi:hypothetical protein
VGAEAKEGGVTVMPADFDRLLDTAHLIGLRPRTDLSWGVSDDGGKRWIRMRLPNKRVTATADTLDQAAAHLLLAEFPSLEDRPL